MRITWGEFDYCVRSMLDIHSDAIIGACEKLESQGLPLSAFSMVFEVVGSMAESELILTTRDSIGKPQYRFALAQLLIELHDGGYQKILEGVEALAQNVRFVHAQKFLSRFPYDLFESSMLLCLVGTGISHSPSISEASSRLQASLRLLLPWFPADWQLRRPVDDDSDIDFDSLMGYINQSRTAKPPGLLRVARLPNGDPVDADLNPEQWKAIRLGSVTATDAMKLLKANGDPSEQRYALLHEKLEGDEPRYVKAFERGVEREPVIARWVAGNFEVFGFRHNRMLIVGENPRHAATPDMIGNDSLCEIKVSTKQLAQIRSKYSDQMQWQMHVTGFESVLFVVENRHTNQIEFEWIQRDNDRIYQLTQAADEFLEALDVKSHERATGPFRSIHLFGAAKRPPAKASNQVESDTDTVDGNADVQILHLFLARKSIYDIASKLNIEAARVATVLAEELLNERGPLVDDTAPNYGKSWNDFDLERLEELFMKGQPIGRIAELLGRDRLAICFKVLMAFASDLRLEYQRLSE